MIRALNRRCGPTNPFIPFRREDIEGTIHGRFDRIAQLYATRPALVADGRHLTYDTLKRTAHRVAQAILNQRGAGTEPDTSGPPLPNPGTLQAYQTHVGKTFKFALTGAPGGSVWGTDAYTLDSSLASAAVHAGVLQVGKTGNVRVRILPPRAGFVGSSRNGIESASFNFYPGAYEFVKK